MVYNRRRIVYITSILFIINILFFIKAGYTQNLPLNKFLNKIQSHQQNIHTLICDIKQIKTSKLFNKPIIFIGKLYYQKPNLIRYEFKYPIYSAIIINNNYILKCTENMPPFKIKKDILSDKLKNINLIFNIHTLNHLKNYFNIKITESNNNIMLYLTPKIKNKGNRINYIKFILKNKNLTPYKIIILDNQNNLTKVILTNIKINCNIPKKIFYKCH